MKSRRALDDRERPRPARRRGALVDGGSHPVVSASIRARELVERERLADALAELVGNDLELREQPWARDGVTNQLVEAPVRFFPLLPDGFEREHGRRMLLRTTRGGPERLQLLDDLLAELVAGTCECEGDVRMEALE